MPRPRNLKLFHITYTRGSLVFRERYLNFRIVIDSKLFTRMGMLSIVCSIFDPLGLVGLYVLKGKKFV